MANLVLRFSIYTQNEEVDIHSILRKISSKNLDNIYALGEKYGGHNRNESSIDFTYDFKNIGAVDDVCIFFIGEWKQYENVLKELNSTVFKSYLLFEFDLENSGFPELVFQNAFLSFLSNIGTELQFFFYT